MSLFFGRFLEAVVFGGSYFGRKGQGHLYHVRGSFSYVSRLGESCSSKGMAA